MNYFDFRKRGLSCMVGGLSKPMINPLGGDSGGSGGGDGGFYGEKPVKIGEGTSVSGVRS